MRNFSSMAKVFSHLNEKIGDSTLLISIRRGLTYLIPLVMIGSLALVFVSLPVPAYQQLMEEVFGTQWKNIFLYVRDGTFNILSLLMVLSISYSYSAGSDERYGHNVSPIITALVALSSFVAISGINKEGFSIANFGVIGIFMAIMVAVISSMLFLKLCSIGALRIRAFTDGANLVFNDALTSIYPAAITVTAFAGINQALTFLWGISDLQSFIADFFNNTFSRMESPFWSAVLFIALVHIFWFLICMAVIFLSRWPRAFLYRLSQSTNY